MCSTKSSFLKMTMHFSLPKRNSLLSTEYQNLRLIFQYAIQINNSSLIVPSQRNSALSLVKVDYSQ